MLDHIAEHRRGGGMSGQGMDGHAAPDDGRHDADDVALAAEMTHRITREVPKWKHY
jgi:hypothetical protein